MRSEVVNLRILCDVLKIRDTKSKSGPAIVFRSVTAVPVLSESLTIGQSVTGVFVTLVDKHIRFAFVPHLLKLEFLFQDVEEVL